LVRVHQWMKDNPSVTQKQSTECTNDCLTLQTHTDNKYTFWC
jgi:hypothetical protein